MKKTPKEQFEIAKDSNVLSSYVKDINLHMVIKDNRLIQEARYNLSAIEQKVYAYICYLANHIEADLKSDREIWVDFSLPEYREIFKITKNGKNNEDIVKAIEKISDLKSYKIMIGDSYRNIRIFSKFDFNLRYGTVRLLLDKDFIPFVCNVKSKRNYSKAALERLGSLKSKYAGYLYELLNSHYCKRLSGIRKKIEKDNKVKKDNEKISIVEPIEINMLFTLDELKYWMILENTKTYKEFWKFKERILDMSIKEINENTNMTVTYQTKKNGRKVESIVFSVKLDSEDAFVREFLQEEDYYDEDGG